MKKLITGSIMAAIVLTAGLAPAIPVPVCGDVNNSGSVTVPDALSVLRKAVGIPGVVLSCSAYEAQVSSCQSALSATNADLGTCSTELSATNADLGSCKSAPVCGNAIVEKGEGCESGDFNGETCVTQGFVGGTLVCTAGCTINTDGCYAARFEDNKDTIIDHETDLEWEKKDGDDGNKDATDPHDVDNPYTWSFKGTAPDGTAFLDFLAALNGASDGKCYAGHCDWRLPTAKEIATILIPYPDCTSAPCVADKPLYPMSDGYYWTSETDASDPASAVDADLSNGYVGLSSDKLSGFHVRAVRCR